MSSEALALSNLLDESSDTSFSSSSSAQTEEELAPALGLIPGHPRWAPTNRIKDIKCWYFLIPVPKKNDARIRHNWLNDRMALNKAEDSLRLAKEMELTGGLMDCVRLKYLMNEEDAQRILIERYGFGAFSDMTNSVYTYRKRPPKYFDNPNIPDWRYEQLRNESRIGFGKMEFENVNLVKNKWNSHYRLSILRGKIKRAYRNHLYQKTVRQLQNNKENSIDGAS